MKKNNKKEITLKSYPSYLIKIIIIIIMISWLLYLFTENTIINYRLKKNGVYIKAVVYEKKSVGAKGTISTKYYFYCGKNKYYGSSELDDNEAIGDTIIVFFLESDPNVNRSNSLLEIPLSSSKTVTR